MSVPIKPPAPVLVKHQWAGIKFSRVEDYPGWKSQAGYVVASCSCGWRGQLRRPEDYGGDVKVWVDDWRIHIGELSMSKE